MIEWVPLISKLVIVVGGIFVGMVHQSEYDYSGAVSSARKKYVPKEYNEHIAAAIYRELGNAWPVVITVYILTLIAAFMLATVYDNSLMILIAICTPFFAMFLSGRAHKMYLDHIAQTYQNRHP